ERTPQEPRPGRGSCCHRCRAVFPLLGLATTPGKGPPMPSWSNTEDHRRAGLWTGILILAVLVAGVGSFVVAKRLWWLQPLASVQGRVIDAYFNWILLVTAIAFIATHLFLAAALIRYGARGKERA